MTSLAHAWVVVVALATAPALAQAQARPDFSGKWEISQAKSSAGATSNSANISFPSEVIITQRPAELHVEVRFPRSEPLTTVYKLDGSEITAGTPAGVTEKAKAAWDGNTLDRKSTRLNSSHSQISYAVFCLKKKKKNNEPYQSEQQTVRRA